MQSFDQLLELNLYFERKFEIDQESLNIQIVKWLRLNIYMDQECFRGDQRAILSLVTFQNLLTPIPYKEAVDFVRGKEANDLKKEAIIVH